MTSTASSSAMMPELHRCFSRCFPANEMSCFLPLPNLNFALLASSTFINKVCIIFAFLVPRLNQILYVAVAQCFEVWGCLNDRFGAVMAATIELYRRSRIGTCLTEALDEMVTNGVLPAQLAIDVLLQFDKSITEALKTQVTRKITLKGHLHSYRFISDVWTFILKDTSFDKQERISLLKIVACDSKLFEDK
ncbi:hypothetical protein QQ045_023843 [Rhodiola kirilowii]